MVIFKKHYPASQQMAKSGQDVLYEGWLTKSPPTKRKWRAKWRRRWFSLTQSGELPGQYVLTYYADRNCRKIKGVINLDHCEQVDLGLKLEERNLKFDHVFDIRTPSRVYFLAADTESEMHTWVKNICRICGLNFVELPENDENNFYMSESNTAGIEIVEETDEDNKVKNPTESPPLSPVSTSPYIPISECITGKSPILDPKDFKTLLQYNIKNAFFSTEAPNSHNNDNYGHAQRNYYNCDMQDPRFYDSPRKLVPPPLIHKDDNETAKQTSPLQSPTDSESVFTDDDWAPNTSSDLNSSKNTRPSDSSMDLDIVVMQRFTKNLGKKSEGTNLAPPRPPKPPYKPPAVCPPGVCYLNLTPTKSCKEAEDSEVSEEQKERIISDDMYDFPRSHVNHTDSDTLKSTMRRHCYNNAAPSNIEGTVFRYDISPKPNSSSQIFTYDLDDPQDEPASPHSQTSSTAAYSNLPSPLLADNQMPPPVVNRDLKPKRKLSDSHSIYSNPEPPSPRGAPSVDRKLKPPTPLQEAHTRKQFNVEEEMRKMRAAPSPIPPNLGRSHESLLYQSSSSQIYHSLVGKMQYLDLDLEGSSGSSGHSNNCTATLPSKNSADNVYKKIDFMKTHAFNVTRNILEKQRQEPVPSKK